MTATGLPAVRQNSESPPCFSNQASLDPLFDPKTVAIIGAEERPGTQGHQVLTALLNGEFRGSTFIVDPQRPNLMGMPTHSWLGAVPGKIDLAVVVASPESAPAMISQCVEKSVRAVVLLYSGFGPVSENRQLAGERMRQLLRGSRRRFLVRAQLW